MKSLAVRLLSVCVCVTVLACGSKTPTGPSNSGSGSTSSGSGSGGGSNPPPGTSPSCTVPGTPATGTMTATIDGVAWRAVCVAVSLTVQGVISIAGGEPTTPTTGTTIGFAAPRSVGSTSIGPLSPTNALLTVGGGSLWQSALNNGSGTVTFTTLTTTNAAGANNAVGTFSFTMTPQSGTTATGTKVVTNGTFNVTF